MRINPNEDRPEKPHFNPQLSDHSSLQSIRSGQLMNTHEGGVREGSFLRLSWAALSDIER
jgi:hypothetical protein